MAQRSRDLSPEDSAKDFFGAELRYWRVHSGLSQAQLAATIHFAEEMICKVEKAHRWPPLDLAEACDAALGTGGVLSRAWPLVEAQRLDEVTRQSERHRRACDAGAAADATRPGSHLSAMAPALGASDTGQWDAHLGTSTPAFRGGRWPVTAESPGTGAGHPGGPSDRESEILMAAYQSAHFADHPSNIGPFTLEQLRADATRLARSFPTAPRLTIFTNARLLHQRVFQLLDGRQRVSESRDLYFLAAVACGMLAHVSDDLGYSGAAMSHAQAGWLCAIEAGHNGLRAWIRNTQSMVAYYDGRPKQATDYARAGQECAPSGTTAAWLSSSDARAVGRLGDKASTTVAIAEAAIAMDRASPDDLDEIGGIFSFSLPKQHFYGAEAHLWLEDSPAIITHAKACLTGYENGLESECAYDNIAQVQADLAIARVLDRDLEAARDAVQPVFGIASGLRNGAIDKRLRALHRRLTAYDIRTNPIAVSLRDQIETYLASASSSLPPA